MVAPVNVSGRLEVTVAEASNVTLPSTLNLSVPLIVNTPVEMTLMPPVESVNVSVQVTVPFTVKTPVPSDEVCPVPSGQVVPAATVKLTLVLVKLTRLRVRLGAVNTAAVPPVKARTPPLALNVGELDWVKLPAETVQVALVAVKLPPENMTDPVVVIAPEPPLNTPPDQVAPRVVKVCVVLVQVPSAMTKIPTLILILWVTMPVYPARTDMLSLKVPRASTVQSRTEVAVNSTLSPLTGTVPPLQLLGVDQLAFPTVLDQVLTAI